MKRVERITIIGGGGWGIALANLLVEDGPVVLWEFFPDAANRLRVDRHRPEVLPGVFLHDGIRVLSDPGEACDGSDLALFVVPSHALRGTARVFAPHLRPSTPIASATKGIEQETLLRMSEVLEQELGSGRSIAVLSGPSHAEEVAHNLPTTLVAASTDPKLASRIQGWMMKPRFRVYTSRDVLGVEIGGALKNIIAIAAGMCSGLGFGDNTMGALLTRGLAEITRLGVAMGADVRTFMGLSGLGDLITTCISKHSRNRSVGERLARGLSLEQIMGGMTMVAEGVRTVNAALALGEKYEVQMPIAEAIAAVFRGEITPQVAAEKLMTRDAKAETEL